MKKIKIKIKGELDKKWTEWFENMNIQYYEGNTVLSGSILDQSALHGILNKIRDLNLELILVNSEFDINNNK